MRPLAIFLGLIIGGVVAWNWKLIHVTFQDWRFAVARMKRTRKLFYRHSVRGALVTAVAAIVLFVLTR